MDVENFVSFKIQKPIGSMYGIYTYIWLSVMVNVGKYTSHMDPSWEIVSEQK